MEGTQTHRFAPTFSGGHESTKVTALINAQQPTPDRRAQSPSKSIRSLAKHLEQRPSSSHIYHVAQSHSLSPQKSTKQNTTTISPVKGSKSTSVSPMKKDHGQGKQGARSKSVGTGAGGDGKNVTPRKKRDGKEDGERGQDEGGGRGWQSLWSLDYEIESPSRS